MATKNLINHQSLHNGDGPELLSLIMSQVKEYQKAKQVPFKEAHNVVFDTVGAEMHPPLSGHDLLSWIMHDINTDHSEPEEVTIMENTVPDFEGRRGQIVRGGVVAKEEDPFTKAQAYDIRQDLRVALAVVEPGQTYMFPCTNSKEIEIVKDAVSGVVKQLGWKLVTNPSGGRDIRCKTIVKGTNVYIHRYG